MDQLHLEFSLNQQLIHRSRKRKRILIQRLKVPRISPKALFQPAIFAQFALQEDQRKDAIDVIDRRALIVIRGNPE
jgi:hypothetical protein